MVKVVKRYFPRGGCVTPGMTAIRQLSPVLKSGRSWQCSGRNLINWNGLLSMRWLKRKTLAMSQLGSDWCGRWDSNPHDVAIEGF
jgi:hypothetical protein